ncbi:phenylalanine--tRNA ligase subunit alpha [Aeromicrobium tamlense]|uniref:Phenylalanine--tRNA ligase alpha subunit n=1 Tax=Aeromicrobium tamlense TaxID=375541 RepID=A0A8I0FX93_9ACTN|nr:phenylalanine--tRNA ligase subunit alpha [Aeromicrobium tamlense]MBD1270646.1 phenylalanine--tRNA ligase subunit alpha [Aeromicrobium tamlense]MBD1271222.1 phenylalanine--tRNA ligase subunit alpha [Aeromicrobium tamlense]NYI38035.1 phenylalanyl-tRNA synthetase alpha chain [Aeromicrobium tamlense]
MSAPNSDYDPVEVTPLRADAVERMRDEALAAIAAADSLDALKQVRIDHTGDRSPLALANREIGALPPAARKDAGQRVGQARGAVNQALAARTAEVEAVEFERRLAAETVDVTLPVDVEPVGARHPITTIQEHVADIFVAMGWEVAEGPEVEAEWLNFDALNLGPDHPARTMQDTFWLDPESAAMVLRTHTSPVQARTMLTRKPPIYVVCPGRVYRTDEADATHMPVFHQVEGLAIDKGLSMAHLKGTLDHFARAVYGTEITTRFRPSYFPFTEPSAEVDLLCYVCHNDPAEVASCRTCGGEGWVEWGGCGVVNPRVLVACGVDPEEYSGFAFGMGLDRTVTSRYDIADLRDLWDGDVRFTEPFGVGL